MKSNLSNASIDSIVISVFDFLEKNKVEQQNKLALRLALEEVLLKFQEALGEDTEIDFECFKRLGRLRTEITIPGKELDPFADSTENDSILRNAMQKIGAAPEWRYDRNANIISFNCRKQKRLSSGVLIIFSILLGVIIGAAAKALLGDLAVDFGTDFMSPISSTILGLLSTLSAFLIFISVTNGIVGMGDFSTFNKIGKKMLFEFAKIICIFSIICICISLFIFPLSAGGTASVDVVGIWNIILAIIPINIPQAFETCNALQIIFLAMFSGIIMLSIIPKVRVLAKVVDQLDTFIQTAIELIVRTMPIVVFSSVYNAVVSGTYNEFFKAYKYVLLVTLVGFVALAYTFIRTSLKHRIPIKLLLHKLLPIISIGFATSSTASTFSTCLNVCEKKLGINKQIVNVGVPLIQTLMKLGGTMIYTFGCFTLAELYNVPITISNVVTLLAAIIIMTAATPSVPGGAASCLVLLFGQFGIPMEALTVIVALDFVVDRLATAAQVAIHPQVLLRIADRLDMLDTDILRKEIK